LQKILIKKVINYLLFFFISHNAFAQVHFVKTYISSLAGQNSYVGKIHETDAGDFVFTSNSLNGAYLVKTDPTGHLKYCKEYSSSNDGNFEDFLILNSGDFLFVGPFEYSSNQVRTLIKTNTDGDILWSKGLGFNYTDCFLSKKPNGKINLIAGTDTGYGFYISDLDSTGNIISTMRVWDTNNASIWISKVKNVNNNRIAIAGRYNNLIPTLVLVDSTNNMALSVQYPGYFSLEDVIPTSDNGFLNLFRDTVGSNMNYSITVQKTDSLGNPIWAKSFSDSSKHLSSLMLYENNDHTYYCFANWLSTSSTLFNFSVAIIHIDQLGNILSIKDSLPIQNYRDLIRTSDNRYCSLIGKGSANNTDAAILMTDTSFTQDFGTCMNYKSSTISNYPSYSTVISSPLQIINSSQQIQFININTTVSTSNYTYTCLPGGVICATTFSTIIISSCDTFLSPAGHSLTISGFYTDTIYNFLGCDSIITINLTILPAPFINIAAQSNTTFCQGDSVNLIATNGLLNYQWYRNNLILTGDTTQNYFAKSRGKYKCVTQNSSSCSDTSNSILIRIPCIPTGPDVEREDIGDLDNSSDFLIYPNPGTGIFNIISNDGELFIYNSMGELIYTQNIRYKNSIIDISEFSNGVYFVNLKTSKSVDIYKLIVSK
jgi:hypothetical protein